tara:strand:- start:57 stop:188 length:132 start_codon:yes stop_codon:yes gene_type:complete
MDGNSQITARLASSFFSFPCGSVSLANTSPPTSFNHGPTLLTY